MSTPDKVNILVIDDEIQIRRLLSSTLVEAGYAVLTAETGALGLKEGAYRRPDAIILDLGLPDLSGIDVLRQLREWSQIPVLILSVHGEEDRKVEALDAGADDYLTKPFGESELLARVRVLLRRPKPNDEMANARHGDIEVDFLHRLVAVKGLPVKLTGKEYSLLRLFIQHRGKVLTHRQILGEIWGADAKPQTHYLHVYVRRLREKLEEDPDEPVHFKTESGIGYRFVG
jgi:two-component system, OmpR family, KDP operon response regulator KdpE